MLQSLKNLIGRRDEGGEDGGETQEELEEDIEATHPSKEEATDENPLVPEKKKKRKATESQRGRGLNFKKISKRLDEKHQARIEKIQELDPNSLILPFIAAESEIFSFFIFQISWQHF
jgi:hypothetical protein